MTGDGDTWTVRRALLWTRDRFAAAGIASPRLDAELLLGATLKLDRVQLIMQIDRPLAGPERAQLRELVRRRLNREPMAYILGHRGFLDFELQVGPGVLVPRPETEFVVAAAGQLAAENALPAGACADLGAGSGAIAIALARALDRPVWAVERDDAARSWTVRNVAALAPERVRVLAGDWDEPLAAGSIALAASNPPYVALGDRDTLAPELAHEPAAALFAGVDGMDAVRVLAARLARPLVPGGWWLCEVGAGQRAAVERELDAAGWAPPRWWRDFAGIDRVFATTPRVS